MAKLRDRVWIWGHPAGVHDEGWGFSGVHSRMTVAESAYYLGARNALMVCYGNKPEPPFDQEAMAMDPLQEVVWSVVGDASSSDNIQSMGHLAEILRIAQVHPNIHGAIFDDFFFSERMKVFTPSVLAKIRTALHSAPGGHLDMWTVVYGHQLDDDIQRYIDEFDGLTFWTWRQDELKQFEEYLQKVQQFARGKRLLLGCYLYDYGNCKEMRVENMAFQLDRYAKAVHAGDAEGIILLSNTVADLGFSAVNYTRQWLAEHGDEEIAY